MGRDATSLHRHPCWVGLWDGTLHPYTDIPAGSVYGTGRYILTQTSLLGWSMGRGRYILTFTSLLGRSMGRDDTSLHRHPCWVGLWDGTLHPYTDIPAGSVYGTGRYILTQTSLLGRSMGRDATSLHRHPCWVGLWDGTLHPYTDIPAGSVYGTGRYILTQTSLLGRSMGRGRYILTQTSLLGRSMGRDATSLHSHPCWVGLWDGTLHPYTDIPAGSVYGTGRYILTQTSLLGRSMGRDATSLHSHPCWVGLFYKWEDELGRRQRQFSFEFWELILRIQCCPRKNSGQILFHLTTGICG